MNRAGRAGTGAPVVGVDVAVRRGCHVVTVDDELVARPSGRVSTADELRALLAAIGPAAVAIDAPRRWAEPGRSRACERELTARGIGVFTTPDAARGERIPFYAWMRTGFEMFEGARGHPTYETFPHAVAVALHGALPDQGLLRRPAAKRRFRLEAIERAGVDPGALRGIDEIDAALCAVAARRVLAGDAVALGEPDEGVITLPGPLPDGRFPRAPAPGPERVPEPVRRRGTR